MCLVVFLHMHDAGKMIWSTQWRNNTYIGTTNRIEFWYFAYQETTPVNYTIYPGDKLNLHCVYDTSSRTTTTTFGVSTMQEMCMEFVSYYPKVNTEFCGYVSYSSINYTYCGNNIIFEQNPVPDDIPKNDERMFGIQNEENCVLITSEIVKSTASISLVNVTTIFAVLLLFVLHKQYL